MNVYTEADLATKISPGTAHQEKKIVDPQAAQAFPKRELIFISYSHKDQRWLRDLLMFLKPATQQAHIYVWDDTKIRPGADWKKEVEKALASTKKAVLLLSPHFLASDYINEEELPSLLNAAKDEGVDILWIPISDSWWERTTIAKYQAVHNPSRPLDTLRKSQLNRAWHQICDIIGTPPTASMAPFTAEQLLPTRASDKPLQQDHNFVIQPPKRVTPEMTEKTTVTEPKRNGKGMQQPLLMAGCICVEQDGQELILVRKSARLPIIKIFDPQKIFVEQAINEAIADLFKNIGISPNQIIEAGFAKPSYHQLYKIDQRTQTIEIRPCIFFKVTLNRTIHGSSTAWKQQEYRWASKDEITQMWQCDDFRYGQDDEQELHLVYIDDPYEAISKDWISLEMGFKILECVDMLIFRNGEKGEIEFLIIQRRNNLGWEYPKGGLFYHETPIEGALREISEETGIRPQDLHYCGYLGWQTTDVKERKKFYDTLRVHGLTFYYKGDSKKIYLDASHLAHQWLPLKEVKNRLWIPYGSEFFKRWDEKRQDILQKAKIANI